MYTVYVHTNAFMCIAYIMLKDAIVVLVNLRSSGVGSTKVHCFFTASTTKRNRIIGRILFPNIKKTRKLWLNLMHHMDLYLDLSYKFLIRL